MFCFLMFALNLFLYVSGGKDRMEYLNSVQFKKGDAHVIRRNNLYEDVLNVYRDQSIVHEYPIEIKYRLMTVE